MALKWATVKIEDDSVTV